MDIKQLHDFVDEISTHIVSIEHLVQKKYRPVVGINNR